MKIRIKSVETEDKEKFIYEVDDENGKITNIDVAYLEIAMKILDFTSKRMIVANASAFKKFITNIKRATRYYDKMQNKVIETPNIIHNKEEYEKATEFHKKYIKYDKKSQALFSLHKGWYDNFVSIIEEIKDLIEKNYDMIKDISEDNVELFYAASRIDMILEKYKKKQKAKTL